MLNIDYQLYNPFYVINYVFNIHIYYRNFKQRNDPYLRDIVSGMTHGITDIQR